MLSNSLLLSKFISSGDAPVQQDATPLTTNIPAGLLVGGDPDDPMVKEMKKMAAMKMKFDNLPAPILAKRAATKVGINPSLFFSSAWQEGMNKAVAKPDEVSEAYLNAKIGNDYPVDGFYNYGVDRFGERAKDLIAKGYLPKDFDYKPYSALNEKNEKIVTAAFKNNESAMMAKAAMMRDTMERVRDMAKKKGVELDDDALNYFTLAGYNSGEGNAQKMLDKYKGAKDKKRWISDGDSEWQRVHKNISPRIKNMKAAFELLENNKEGQDPKNILLAAEDSKNKK